MSTPAKFVLTTEIPRGNSTFIEGLMERAPKMGRQIIITAPGGTVDASPRPVSRLITILSSGSSK